MVLSSILCQANNGPTSIITPVRSKETRESSDKDDTSIIRNLGSIVTNLSRGRDEANIVTQPLDCGACNGDGTFEHRQEGILKLVANGGQEAILGNDWFIASVV